MPKVFICYRREDSGGYAGRLYDRLSRRFGEKNVFMDVDTIAPGEDFGAVIDNTIKECDVVVAVMGRNWASIPDQDGRPRLNSPTDFVRVELNAALQGHIDIIPTLVAGASVPEACQLPTGLIPLVRKQAIDIREPGFHESVDRLIQAIAVTADRNRTGRTMATSERVSASALKRIQQVCLRPTVLFAVLTLVAVGCMWHWRQALTGLWRSGDPCTTLPFDERPISCLEADK